MSSEKRVNVVAWHCCDFMVSKKTFDIQLKPHLHALKNRHGTPNFWHRADDFKARHSQFSTCKRIGPKCNVASVLKILGVLRRPPEGSLGTGQQGTVPKFGVPCWFFSTCKWGFWVYQPSTETERKEFMSPQIISNFSFDMSRRPFGSGASDNREFSVVIYEEDLQRTVCVGDEKTTYRNRRWSIWFMG